MMPAMPRTVASCDERSRAGVVANAAGCIRTGTTVRPFTHPAAVSATRARPRKRATLIVSLRGPERVADRGRGGASHDVDAQNRYRTERYGPYVGVAGGEARCLRPLAGLHPP